MLKLLNSVHNAQKRIKKIPYYPNKLLEVELLEIFPVGQGPVLPVLRNPFDSNSLGRLQIAHEPLHEVSLSSHFLEPDHPALVRVPKSLFRTLFLQRYICNTRHHCSLTENQTLLLFLRNRQKNKMKFKIYSNKPHLIAFRPSLLTLPLSFFAAPIVFDAILHRFARLL